MSFINSMFDTETPVSAAFYSVTKTNTNGDISAPVEALSMTKSVLFWRGAMAENLVSERLKTEIDGVIAIDFEDYDNTVNDDDVVVIDSIKYTVIHADNIAEQDEVIIIPVKRKNT